MYSITYNILRQAHVQRPMACGQHKSERRRLSRRTAVSEAKTSDYVISSHHAYRTTINVIMRTTSTVNGQGLHVVRALNPEGWDRIGWARNPRSGLGKWLSVEIQARVVVPARSPLDR